MVKKRLTRLPPPLRSIALDLVWRSLISPETEERSVWKVERKEERLVSRSAEACHGIKSN